MTPKSVALTSICEVEDRSSAKEVEPIGHMRTILP